MKKGILVLLCFVFLAGCATQRANLQKMETKRKPDFEKWDHFFVWGLVPGKVVTPASKACPNANLARYETEITPPNALAGVVTLGFYQPHTLKIYCTQ